MHAFRFVSELYGALRTRTLFRRPYNNHGELNLKTIIASLSKSDQINVMARKMSIIEGLYFFVVYSFYLLSCLNRTKIV